MGGWKGRGGARALSPETYRVGMMWLTLTNLTKGFSLVRFLILSLLIALVTWRDGINARRAAVASCR